MGIGALEGWEPSTGGRAARLLMMFRLTRKRSGAWRALLFALKTIIVKLPQLVAQTRALHRRDDVRTEIARARIERTNDAPHLALAITGGVGDYIAIARFIRDLATTAGPIVFDVFASTPGRCSWAFSAVPGFRAAYHDVLFEQTQREYDLAFRANQMLVVYREFVRWDALRRAPRLLEVVGTIIEARSDIDVFVRHHPWMDNHLARTVVFGGRTRRDYLQHLAGLDYGGDRLAVPTDMSAPERFGLSGQRYITIHNGFDTGFVVSGRRATKCYPHFGTVVTSLKQRFTDLVFVQVGTKTSEQIPECHVNLLNRTNLAEVAGLIAGARLHLDNESGLVHLASCLGTRCAVVFGPTPSDFFGYPANINIDPPICGNCWWMTQTWMDMCAKGYDAPRCMTEQDPHAVAEIVLAALLQMIPPVEEPIHSTLSQPPMVVSSGKDMVR